ncbi:MAG: ABC transporter substrate-binding protein [Myxococcales bacterium]|nr:ABC transporter substrate-binding protein [Myxococcales bacterium]
MASAAEGALDTFRTSHTKVSSLLASRADTSALQTEVDNLLDYHALAVESLGGAAQFPKRCEPRCDELETLLARLIRENYLRRLRSDKDHKVTFVGEEKRPRGVRVQTTVEYVKEGRPVVVEVDYLMHEVDGRWQVRDIITDGVSLARNYKYEFNQILKQDGIDGLIARLESKLALVAKKD